MGMEFSTENLKVGDKVILHYSNYGRFTKYVGEITKKTPTGLVDVSYDGRLLERFKPDGYPQRKRSRYSFVNVHLGYWSEEEGREIQMNNLMEKIRDIIENTNFNKEKDDVCLMVYAALKGQDDELLKQYRNIL